MIRPWLLFFRHSNRSYLCLYHFIVLATMSALVALMEGLKVADSNSDAFVNAVKADPKNSGSVIESLANLTTLTGKDDNNTVKNALNAIEALITKEIKHVEAYVNFYLAKILCAGAHKDKAVRDAATSCVLAFSSNMSPDNVRMALPVLFEASKGGFGLQGGTAFNARVLALNAIQSFSENAPEQLGFSLPKVVPEVTGSMSDPKKDVAKAAHDALVASCDVIGNRDIEHMTAKIVRSIIAPADVPEIMHALAGVTFVQSVQSPALAMVVPLLLRGLRSNLTATRRQSAVIIDNMSKLVDDPIDAAPFLPILLPDLVRSADAMSDPEARKVSENAVKQLQRLEKECHLALKGAHFASVEKVVAAIKAKLGKGTFDEVKIEHIANLACSLMERKKFDEEEWKGVQAYLTALAGDKVAATAIETLRPECKEMVKFTVVEEEVEDGEELCNCQFTLAYGTKILLHNTAMRLKRGHKYGLLGGNDSGKTTLMRSIANGSLTDQGFPDPASVRTVFVEADIMGELSHLSCVDYIMQDERLKDLDKNDVLAVMATVGFREDGKAKPFNGVSTLSGGWRMKLALARAMLQKADILLMDEPTNHLDVINVAWVKNYINSLKTVTCIMVSHDSKFLNECCTDILHIERLKLKHFKGNLDVFKQQNPEVAAAFFSIKESKLKFKFPQPGPIEGVKSRSKALMKMSHCDFTYPGNKTPTLFDISIQVSMASRVGCVGENGAGKSTMIKVLTGEVVPQTGDVWRHPNARVAYVAQHAFHHIEQHLNKTPNEYIRWRYANGEDKESLVKVSMVATEEELQLQRTPFEVLWKDDEGKQCKANKVVVELTGNRREARGKEYEYDVKYRDGSEFPPLPLKILEKRGWGKACRAIDARIAQLSGMFIRTLSSANVEQHLADIGLEAEFGTHYRMSALSGGQKVKVVMAAAMWSQPHILILDEPTNYLDRESLGALAHAIEGFEGGVVIISHNNEFVSTLCPEEWVMDAGHLTTRGDVGWMNRQDDKISDQVAITTMTDALGNESEVKQAKKVLTKVEEKKEIKRLRAKIKAGEELDDEEHEFAIAQELL
jgi:elongation factor 3